MRRLFALFIVCGLGLGLTAGPASAKKKPPVYVPPQSAAGQYTEDVPTAGGNTPAGSVHPTSGGSGGSGGSSSAGSSTSSSGGSSSAGSGVASSVSAKTIKKLDQSGAAGRKAASLAAALAPSAPAATTKTTASAAGAPASDVVKTLAGSDAGSGIGVLLPVILIASLIGATVLGVLRLRRPS
jgi:hypothetical protein